MDITVTDPANTTGPDVTFILSDKGSAHVSITLIIKDVTVLRHEETFEGSLSRTLQIPKGTHQCTLVLIAFKTGALGPVFNTSVKINGKNAATARGSIPSASDSDFAFKQFQLVVA